MASYNISLTKNETELLYRLNYDTGTVIGMLYIAFTIAVLYVLYEIAMNEINKKYGGKRKNENNYNDSLGD